MTTPTDFFDNAFDPESRSAVRRDGYGRALLVPRGGSKADRQPYTSMSTLAGMLSDDSGIQTWEKRLLTRGLGGRPDLVALAAAVQPLTGDPDYDRISNSEVDSIIERALDFAGRDVKADWGTAVHAFTDPGAARERIPSEQMANDVAAYDHAMAGARQVMSEEFVANDALTAAGSFDGTWRLPGIGHVIGDKKTGRYKALQCAIQLAGYRMAEPYDVHDDSRGEWPDDLSSDLAITIHIPYGQARCFIYGIDLGLGRELAALAAQVRDARKVANKGSKVRLDWALDVRGAAYGHLLDLAGQVRSAEEANALWSANKDLWDAACTAAARNAVQA